MTFLKQTILHQNSFIFILIFQFKLFLWCSHPCFIKGRHNFEVVVSKNRPAEYFSWIIFFFQWAKTFFFKTENHLKILKLSFWYKNKIHNQKQKLWYICPSLRTTSNNLPFTNLSPFYLLFPNLFFFCQILFLLS